MESIRKLRNYNYKTCLKNVTLIELFLFAMFLLFLVVTRSSYHLLFHTSAELYVCLVSFGLFFIALNTNSINKNYFITFLGIGYFFIAIIDMFHVFTYSGVSIIFENGNLSIGTQLWISARYITSITLLISTVLIYSNVKKFRLGLVLFIYFFICVFACLLIFYFKIFPDCYIAGQGLTHFKIGSEYVITVILLLVAALYFDLRKNIDFNLFIYMEGHLIFMAISEILFSSYLNPYDWPNVWSHIIRVISYFFLYKALIENGLRRPYSILFHKLDKIDNELSITNSQLKLEQHQREMIEEMLIKNDQCYELIINNSSDAIIITSKDQITFANDRAAKIFGVNKPAELIGLNFLNFVHPLERSKVKNQVENQQLHQIAAEQCEYKILSVKGDIIEAEMACESFLYQGKLSEINILKDVSPQNQISRLKKDIIDNAKVLNETKEYNRLLTEFFSNISHELKTPLNVILGAIQILSMPRNLNLPQNYEMNLSKYLKVMRQNCYRLLRLVNNLIDLSKFDSGYLKLNLRNHNIVSVVEEIILSVADYVETRGLSIIFDTDTEEKIIAADADKIERIILNLLSNAIKFTNKGGSIFVNMYDKGERIAISVRDTGIGIPEDKLNTIFERFGQVDKTLVRNREGSGIGLSLVKTLVEMHGGTISISSKEGEGSEIYIELPVRTVKDEITLDNSVPSQVNVEKISIEFSDIYSYD